MSPRKATDSVESRGATGGEQDSSLRSKARQLALTDLDVGLGIQTRAKLDEAAVQEYAQAMRDGAEFPSVTVFAEGETFRLADGFHRVAAAKLAGASSILAKVWEGNKQRALLWALGANTCHGLRRTNADKRHAVALALREFPGESDRAIAEVCQVGNALVGEVRRQVFDSNTSSSRKGRDGKRYPAHRTARPKVSVKDSDPADPSDTAIPKPVPGSFEQEQEREMMATGKTSPVDASGDLPLNTPTIQAGEMRAVNAAVCPPQAAPVQELAATASLAQPAVTESASVTVTSSDSPTLTTEHEVTNEPMLIPADKVQAAVSKISSNNFASSDGAHHLAQIARGLLPMLADVFNDCAHENPDVEGRDLARAVSVAHARLQVTMGWT